MFTWYYTVCDVTCMKGLSPWWFTLAVFRPFRRTCARMQFYHGSPWRHLLQLPFEGRTRGGLEAIRWVRVRGIKARWLRWLNGEDPGRAGGHQVGGVSLTEGA